MAKKPTAAKAPVAEKATGLVKMKRDPLIYAAPHECDCHPAEVQNFKAGGWQEV